MVEKVDYSLASLRNRGIEVQNILPGFGSGNLIRKNGLYEARGIDNLIIAFYLTYDQRRGGIITLRRLSYDLTRPGAFRFTARDISDGIAVPLVEDRVGTISGSGYIIRDVTDGLLGWYQGRYINRAVKDPLVRHHLTYALSQTTNDIIAVCVANLSATTS